MNLDFLAKSVAKPGTDIVPVSEARLPAVVSPLKTPLVFDRQSKFERLIELRGHEPKPMKTRYWLLNHGSSWGLVLGATAALASVPLTAGAIIPFYVAALSSGGALLLGSAIGGMLNSEVASPLSLVTRWNHLRERDLAFLGEISEAHPVEQAVVGILAERWITRINAQRVYGEAAYATLEDIIARKKSLPEDVINRAERLVNLYDATVARDTGYPLTYLTDEQVRNIISYFTALDPEDRAACGPELMKRYFKGEVARYKVESHPQARQLYRTLRDGMKEPQQVA